MSHQKKPRKDLTLQKKVEILQELEASRLSQAAIAKKFEISTSTMSRLFQNKSSIIQQHETLKNKDRKRKRGGGDEELDEALFQWFKEKLAQGARLSGPEIQSKALQLAEVKGEPNFQASSGWLWRWKTRYNVVFKKQQGERQDADDSSARQWLEAQMPDIICEFSEKDIFNADETALYFRAFNDKGHCLSTEDLSGGKIAKERITVLLCANMDGSEKLPLLIVGKSRRPRCFPKDVSKLPVDYAFSKNAWMTGEIFSNWLTKWDRKLRHNNRKVCLLIDNCSAHSPYVTLTNIILRFLPPNTTSLIQPMDQGVIRNWKGHYRSTLNHRIITALDADESVQALQIARKINLLDAIYIAKSSWSLVQPATITNCYRKAGFGRADEPTVDDDLHDVPVPQTTTREEFERFVSLDDHVITSGETDDATLLEEARQKRHVMEDCDEDDDDEPQRMTKRERQQLIDSLRRFSQEQCFSEDHIVHRSLRYIEALSMELNVEEATQSRLDQFFTRNQ